MRIAIVLLFAGLLTACSSTTEPDPTTPLVLIGSAADGSVTVDLYAEATFSAGYQNVYLDVRSNGSRLADAHVVIDPIMDMGMMKHSCPTEQPGTTPNGQGYYAGAIVFTMAGTANQWTVNVSVHDHGSNMMHTLSIPVAVEASSNVSVIKDGMHKTIVTLVGQDWRVGMNDVQFLVYETMDGFAFTPVQGLSTSLEPTMPSMGHGSEGNVDPTHAHDAWYAGKVNFTMTGEWDLALELFQGEDPMASTNFLVNVK